ncbi:uncharacterized protein LOC143482016 [Brachyhypopomus gauderio]|uniref:uncharacterized protein LOC143482016 n=1 Tax=Brachyhypopomus gauderio TaxID=698409 RepID=UPI004041CB3E
MIHLMCIRAFLGLTVVLMSAGGCNGVNSTSCHKVAKVSLEEMCHPDNTSERDPYPHLQCYFYSVDINVPQSCPCVLNVSGAELLGTEDKNRIAVRNVLRVCCMCTEHKPKFHICEESTVGVWSITIPIVYFVVGLTVVGFVVLLSLALNCLACVSHLTTKGTRVAMHTRSYKAEERSTDSAPEQRNKDEVKMTTEEDLCYATVIYPAERVTHKVNYEQRTEYATVVRNSADGEQELLSHHRDNVDNSVGDCE